MLFLQHWLADTGLWALCLCLRLRPCQGFKPSWKVKSASALEIQNRVSSAAGLSIPGVAWNEPFTLFWATAGRKKEPGHTHKRNLKGKFSFLLYCCKASKILFCFSSDKEIYVIRPPSCDYFPGVLERKTAKKKKNYHTENNEGLDEGLENIWSLASLNICSNSYLKSQMEAFSGTQLKNGL